MILCVDLFFTKSFDWIYKTGGLPVGYIKRGGFTVRLYDWTGLESLKSVYQLAHWQIFYFWLYVVCFKQF